VRQIDTERKHKNKKKMMFFGWRLRFEGVGVALRCWAACERHAARRKKALLHGIMACAAPTEECSAPATREEDVMVTLRSGIRDAADELDSGVRRRRNDEGDVGAREMEGNGRAYLWVRNSSSAAANLAS
jgi:hypothetical protein